MTLKVVNYYFVLASEFESQEGVRSLARSVCDSLVGCVVVISGCP